MSRGMLVLLALALSLPSAGCCLCASPYDYCGPTFTGDCGEQCMTDARMGSVFSGPVATALPYEELPAESDAPSSDVELPVDDSAPAPPAAPQDAEGDGYYPREDDSQAAPMEEPAALRGTAPRQR